MKKFVIFATPRTGSTFIYEALTHYLEQKLQYQPGVGEYFNNLRKSPHVAQSRLQKIKSGDTRLCKLFPMSFQHDGVFDHYNDEYNFICIERQDKFKQVVSWYLARTSRVWCNGQIDSRASAVFPKFRVTKNEFLDYIKDALHQYSWYKSKIKNLHTTIYMEDAVKFSDRREVLGLMGFNDWQDVIIDEANLTQKFEWDKYDSSQFFHNDMEELRNWFNEYE